MLYREIAKLIAQYLFYFSFLFVIPFGVSIYYEWGFSGQEHPQEAAAFAFVYSFVATLLISFLFAFLGRRAKGTLYRREALAIVASIWFITAIVGAFPFYFSKTFEEPLDCYFETMSGLTTTGASVMHPKAYDPKSGQEIPCSIKVTWAKAEDYQFYGTIRPVRDQNGQWIEGIEAVAKGILFWRSFLQWLGGMGIVVLFVAILPALGIGGKVLYQAEVPGPSKDAVTPRVKETASILWKLYFALSVIEITLLLFSSQKMDLFEASVITFSNLSTGGFSSHSASIAYYESSMTEWIVMLFMLLGSINFSLYFYFLKGKLYRLYDTELIVYLLCLLAVCSFSFYALLGVKTTLLHGNQGAQVFSFADTLRYACFHLVSAQTSTGFASCNFNLWPFSVQVVMLLVMFVGSMSGSTGGGIKIIRHYMLFFIAKNKIESIFRPETVRTLRIGSREVNYDAAITVLSYFFIVVAISALSTLALSLDGVDPETSLSVTVCMINNIGIAFRAAAPIESFAFLSSFGKILSSFLMVLGRLEFFALLILLVPAFWKSN